MIVRFALAVCVLIAYLPSFIAPFQLDDYGTIVDNVIIRNLWNLPFIWEFDPSRFLPHLSFAVNYALGGLDVFGYHLINFILHGLTGIVVFLLTQMILRLQKFKGEDIEKIALTVCVLFLLHPIQTSTVTYTVQRSTIMAALFYLSALYFYGRFRLKEGSFVWAVVAMVLGVFCKPNFITLPLAVLLFEFLFLQSKKYKQGFAWKNIFVLCLPIIVIPVLLALWQKRAGGTDELLFMARETAAISRGTYLLTQIHVLIDYIRLMLFPAGLNLDYDYPLITTLKSPRTILRLVLLLGLFSSAMLMLRRRPLYAFGILFFFLSLSVESSIFPIADVIFEHRVYLPLFGFCLVVVPVLYEWLKPKYRKPLFCCVVIALIVATGYRNYIWSDRIVFLEDNYKKSPNKPRVINRLGFAYLQEKEPQKAFELFSKAIEIDPTYPESYLNRALLYQEFNQLELALNDYNAAINARAYFYEAYNNRGMVLAALGQNEWALKDYNQALKLNRYFAPAYINRGILLTDHGKYQEALDDFNRAVRVDPANAHVYNNRGITHIKTGNNKAAVADFKKAAELDPSLKEAQKNYQNATNLIKP